MKKKVMLLIALVAISAFAVCGCGSYYDELTDEEIDEILEGKTEVPETLFKTQEEVEAMFEAAGFTPKFVVRNFDETATEEEHYLRTGECDEIDEGSGADYYSYGDVGDRSGYYAEEGATIIVGYSDHDFDGTSSEADTVEDSEDSDAESEAPAETVEVEETNSELDEFNKILAEYLLENKGFATGTLDENGNPTENGTVYEEFLPCLYIDKIEYTEGGDGEVYIYPEFEALNEDGKSEVAASAQGIIMANISAYKELDTSDYQRGTFLTIYSGLEVVGCSKVLDLKEYKWY